MGTAGTGLRYRHVGVALLRSAVYASTDAPGWWPDPDDSQACRLWLRQVWAIPNLAEAIGQASPTLAHRVSTICAGRAVASKQVRRATVAVCGYLLRAFGRPTPFGLFAGVAPVTLARTARVRWGSGHQPVVRVDTQWLADVIDQLETQPDLLERVEVVFTDLAVRRGGRLEAPCGPGRVHVRHTSAVRAVQEAASSPVRFDALVDKLAETFNTDRSRVEATLAELVRQGFLITSLRAPLTTTDPLAHLLDRLGEVDADQPGQVASLLDDLAAVRADVQRLNHAATAAGPEEGRTRAAVVRRMRDISTAGRTPLAVDLRLDTDVHIPEHVTEEIERAANALLRLSRHPAGWPAWRDYHTAFCDRYGTGTLVPVTDVVDPDTGLGYPAGYPGSILPTPVEAPSPRDERLLVLAWQTILAGNREIVLTDDIIRAVAGDEWGVGGFPPHVELAARIHAATVEALVGGDYSVTVAPARAGGTLTSRFTPTALGSGLEEVYRDLPVAVKGALPVQMSFPPAYPHAENVCRIPAYLPHVLSLGEHRQPGNDHTIIPISDLAITASRDRLYLVSISRRRVIEPQVFHALALDKQPPTLARFLAHLPRAYSATWTVLDWGPYAEQLPYLPRVRYRRCVLAPARWRLTATDLPHPGADHDAWRNALQAWRARLGCPATVELREDDRSLRLVLDEPVHTAILHTHLHRHGHAIFTEPAPEEATGWMGGHAHEIAVPLVCTGAATPAPPLGSLPLITNRGHGQWPGQPDGRWLSARIHTHPDRHDEIIAERFPDLAARLGPATAFWFIRYRNPHQSDHLRLRLRIPDGGRYGAYLAAVGDWARQLHRDGLASGLVIDSYHPEVGRYGAGPALDAAEQVFIADSRVVSVQLRHLRPEVVPPVALAAVSMVHIVCAFLGQVQAMRWLATHPIAAAGTGIDRAIARQAIRLAQPGALADLPGFAGQVAQAWQTRLDALASYRDQLHADADIDTVVESLLHMHHNRALGIDPDREQACRRLAYQAVRAWHARQTNGHDQ